MSSKRDSEDEPLPAPATDPAAVARVRARALAAMRQAPPVRPWRAHALRVVAATAAATLAGAAVVAVVNWPLGDLLVGRALGLALLFFGQAAGLWAALSPRRPS